MFRFLAVTLMAFLVAFATAVSAQAQEGLYTPRVLVIGDSLLDWHRITRQTIPDNLAAQTGWPVESRALSGAKMYHTGSETKQAQVIPLQYEAARAQGPWDWVVISGGANDLLTRCGCAGCARTLNGLIAEGHKTGIIPDLVRRIRRDGAQVAMVGYIGNPRLNLFSGCRDEVRAMARRQVAMAQGDPGVIYVSARAAVNPKRRSTFALDGIHPSRKSTRAVAAALAEALQAARP